MTAVTKVRGIGEEVEDLGQLLSTDPEVPERVDLVLGTRGWRRFAWRHPKALLEGKDALAREALYFHFPHQTLVCALRFTCLQIEYPVV